MQREQEVPSVTAVAAAQERLLLSEEVRDETGMEHTYPLRAQDEAAVEDFYAEFGELPPRNYFRRLWWFLRSR
jgi:hypothetical protein